MKKLLSILLVVSVAALFLANPAFASHGDPVGGCLVFFELHHMMDPSGEPMHRHIGITVDLNGDGYLCMLMLSEELHLHVDNFLPLP
jgi:hypothetical protein